MSIDTVKASNMSTLQPFNSKGCRLVSKDTGIVYDKYEKQALKDILPENAYSYDLVKVETGYGVGSTFIVSTKDKENQLLERVVEEHKYGEEPKKIVSSYKRKMDSFYEDSITKNQTITQGRKSVQVQDIFIKI